jgi:hypothetical protein
VEFSNHHLRVVVTIIADIDSNFCIWQQFDLIDVQLSSGV